MPIQKDVSTQHQVSASFHVIKKGVSDFMAESATLTVKSYVSQSAYEAGATALATKRYTVTGDKYSRYFARDVLQEKGKDPVTQAEKYLLGATSRFGGGTVIDLAAA